MPFGVLSGVPNVITHAKFCVNRLRGFSATAPRKVPFPILFWTTLTTVLHYRADCDLQPLWYNRSENLSNSLKNAKYRLLRRSRSFKVSEVGFNRKPVCDFLLVINSNWHHISYRFGVIAAYCSNFGHFAFLSHPLGAKKQRTMFIFGSFERA